MSVSGHPVTLRGCIDQFQWLSSLKYVIILVEAYDSVLIFVAPTGCGSATRVCLGGEYK